MKRRSAKQILTLVKLINMTNKIEAFRSIGWHVTFRDHQEVYFKHNKDMYNYLIGIIDSCGVI